MSASGASNRPAGGRRAVWVAIGVAAVIVVAIIIALSVRGNASAPSSTDGPSAGSSSTPRPTETPDPSAPSSQPPVAITDPATPDAAPGVTVAIANLTAVDGEAVLPGDVAGPAIRFDVVIHNGSAAELSLAVAHVNVYYGSDQTPASDLSAPGAVPFPASAAAGADATGTFVFTVPVDQRDDVTITLDYAAGAPALVFHGATPRP